MYSLGRLSKRLMFILVILLQYKKYQCDLKLKER